MNEATILLRQIHPSLVREAGKADLGGVPADTEGRAQALGL